MDLNSVNITATQVAKNYFSAYVENGFIYSYSVYGERQQVGVTNDAYTALQKTAQEALDKAEKYYQRLVELGDIVPPKTSEETIAELMSVVSELRNEIREMKTVQHKGDLKEVYEDIEEDIYLCVNGEHFDEDLAKQAVSEMINAGGTTGEKWSKERTDEAARIVGITENLWDFYYVINMYYSDYNTVIGEDITMAAKLSKAFIEDVDVPEGKAYRYYKYVVKDE